MATKAKFVGMKEINGKSVSFFTPPHDEPDFLWVDVAELAKAFLPRSAARKLLRHSWSFARDMGDRPAQSAINGSAIVTIIPHSMAQGLCGAIDEINGEARGDDEWGGGPAETKYSVAAGHALHDFMPGMGFEGLFKAYHNVGGPFLRSVRKEAKGGAA